MNTIPAHSNILRCFLRSFIRVAAPLALLTSSASSQTLEPVTIKVTDVDIGNTPEIMGYNLGHFTPGSNTSDWWRYSGANGARAFVVRQFFEPVSKKLETVNSAIEFKERRDALRKDPECTEVDQPPLTQHLWKPYIAWSDIISKFRTYSNYDPNTYRLREVLDTFHNGGPYTSSSVTYPYKTTYDVTPVDFKVEVLIQLSNSGEFGADVAWPLTSDQDWGNLWLMWRHYYSVAYLLAKNFDVHRYQINNELDKESGMSAAMITRMRYTSDAIQCAIADVNLKRANSTLPILSPLIYAPTVSSGYDIDALNMGDTTLANINSTLESINLTPGSASSTYVTPVTGTTRNTKNYHVHDYHNYSTSSTNHKRSVGNIRDLMVKNNVTGVSIALTEFNALVSGLGGSTLSNVGAELDNAGMDDSNIMRRYGPMAMDAITSGVNEMYLYKFMQTQSDMNKPNQGYTDFNFHKWGTHYVDNPVKVKNDKGELDYPSGTSGLPRQIGGITGVGEIARLMIRACGSIRPMLSVSPASPKEITSGKNTFTLHYIATKDVAKNVVYLMLANRDVDKPFDLTIDISGLGIPENNWATVQEVSGNPMGNMAGYLTAYPNLTATLTADLTANLPTSSLSTWRGGIQNRVLVPRDGLLKFTGSYSIPHGAFWLITLPLQPKLSDSELVVEADACISDGISSAATNGNSSTLLARNDGNTGGKRSVALLRFNPTANALVDAEQVILQVNAASSTEGTAQAHIYGLSDPAFTESSVSWSNYSNLRQNAAPGFLITDNVVLGHGKKTFIQGQLITDSTTPKIKRIDVTDYAKKMGSNPLGFLIAQESRWNTPVEGLYGDQITEFSYKGDRQTAGINITSKEGNTATNLAPRLIITRRKGGADTWRYNNFGSISSTANSASSADPDGDGAINLLEYALGSDPNSASSTPVAPKVTVEGGRLVLRFTPQAADVYYTLQSSTDLINWVSSGNITTSVGIETTANDTELLATGGATRRFLRLLITAKP